MFRKQGVCICTAAGAGVKTTLRDMADSLFFWGVARIYKYGTPVAATDWTQITDKKRREIERKTTAMAEQIRRRNGKVKPGLKTRGFFRIMSMMQKNGFNPRDVQYWKEKGWTAGKRPWRQIPDIERRSPC